MNRAEKVILKCFDDFLKKNKGKTVSVINLTHWAHNKRISWKDAFDAIDSLKRKSEIYICEEILGRVQHVKL